MKCSQLFSFKSGWSAGISGSPVKTSKPAPKIWPDTNASCKSSEFTIGPCNQDQPCQCNTLQFSVSYTCNIDKNGWFLHFLEEAFVDHIFGWGVQVAQDNDYVCLRSENFFLFPPNFHSESFWKVGIDFILVVPSVGRSIQDKRGLFLVGEGKESLNCCLRYATKA